MFTLLILSPGIPMANDASFEGQGASVHPAKENRIRMISETVDIRYNHEAIEDRRLREWLADCVFRFENLTDEKAEIRMGFPDWEAYSESLDDKWAIGDFEAFVDGEKVHTTRKNVTPGSGKKKVLLPGGGEIPYDAAYTWRVAFAPRGVVTVRNRYAFGGASSMGPFSDIVEKKNRPGKPSIKKESLFWADGCAAEKAFPDYGNSAYREVLYIVTTGLTWAETIGEAHISMEIPPDVLPHLVIALPPGHQIRDGKIRWTFKNWRPASEIALYLLFPIPAEDGEERIAPIFKTAREAENWIRIAKENRYDRETVKILRDAVLAGSGAAFQDPARRRYFERFYWYAPEKKLPDITLSAEEIKIISLLTDFERSLPAPP
ncbi:MAG: YARHG domain-containing protein [Desulfobacterales bacterium]|nr:YARHG domain-containing protein [Desulfobacterales bacterium]